MAAACSSSHLGETDDADVVVPTTTADAAVVASAILPTTAGPSLGVQNGQYLSDEESCGACHPDAFAQQQASVHALASFNNPIYRMAVERLRDEEGRDESLVCAGCHDAALLADGAMGRVVEARDGRAHNGVSCRLCHGIVTASRDGNGSYVLEREPLPIPVDGDAESVQRHKKAVLPPPISELCGSCHQSFLSPQSGNAVVLGGQNEMLAWANSAYAGQGASRIDSVEQQTCVDCHMPKEAATLGDVAANANGEISSHRALGGHTWLAAMRGDAEQASRISSFLQTAATIDVMGQNIEGRELSFDVVIRNTGAGHHFPGGVRDAANTRVRVRVLADDGRVLLQSGEADEQHVLRAYVADEDGQLLFGRQTHKFSALIADHTIAPRDVAVVRYRGQLPASQDAERIEVELVHQSRSAMLHRQSCAEMKSARGRSFAALGDELGAGTANACIAQPKSIIASTTRSTADTGEQSFDRNYEHGLGLLHELQERAERARASLERALLLAGNDREKAMAIFALAMLSARVGLDADALARFAAAQALVPQSAAIAAGRGDALAKTWRWQAAAREYALATQLAPRNASIWRRYAIALGSSGQRTQALEAAQTGLELVPRNADLLRVQALALRAHNAIDANQAMQSYLAHRGSDNRGAIIKRCTDRSEVCAREALPVHEHVLRRP